MNHLSVKIVERMYHSTRNDPHEIIALIVFIQSM